MHTEVTHQRKKYFIDLSDPVDISIPLANNEKGVLAWHVDPVRIEPFRAGNFIGAVKEGSSVNFMNISFNLHGNGTHTECVGHIAENIYSVNRALKEYFFSAQLITVEPVQRDNDKVIEKEQLEHQLLPGIKALIIRTKPNPEKKRHRNYSGTNPPYFSREAILYMAGNGIEHLLTDLPSVDKEEDEGRLAAHKAFWNYPEDPQFHKTITELIYVPDAVADGFFFLNLQTAPVEADAAPSRPLLFKPEAII